MFILGINIYLCFTFLKDTFVTVMCAISISCSYIAISPGAPFVIPLWPTFFFMPHSLLLRAKRAFVSVLLKTRKTKDNQTRRPDDQQTGRPEESMATRQVAVSDAGGQVAVYAGGQDGEIPLCTISVSCSYIAISPGAPFVLPLWQTFFLMPHSLLI